MSKLEQIVVKKLKEKLYSLLDKVLLWLIYRRWRMLGRKIDGKTFLSSDYAKRRKSYESLMWEVRKNDL